VKSTTKRPSKEQPVSDLPSLDWRVVVVRRPTTRGGSFVARRYGVEPAIADLIADLAGLGQEAGRGSTPAASIISNTIRTRRALQVAKDAWEPLPISIVAAGAFASGGETALSPKTLTTSAKLPPGHR
jgi:hypothetical protein